MAENKRQTILNTVQDLVSDFVYYDRKEDEDLSTDQMNEAIETGVITVDEIVAEFRKHLEKTYPK
jgi:hypothetical protein